MNIATLNADFKCNLDFAGQYGEYIKKIEKNEKYEDAKALIHLGKFDKIVSKDKVKEACSKIQDFLGSDGLLKSSKKS